MWLSVDPLWEKNIDASPYSYCHGNPVKLIDPDGRDEYIFNEEGVFVGSIPKKGEHTGLWMGTKDREAIIFKFADPVNDPEAINSGDVKYLEFITDEMIDNALWNSGVYNEENKTNRYKYIFNESSTQNNNGEGKMDYVNTANFQRGEQQELVYGVHISQKEETLFLTKTQKGTFAHNGSNFGNFLWGAGANALGFSEFIARLGAHFNNMFIDPETSGFDSSDDQFSISLGFDWRK